MAYNPGSFPGHNQSNYLQPPTQQLRSVSQTQWTNGRQMLPPPGRPADTLALSRRSISAPNNFRENFDPRLATSFPLDASTNLGTGVAQPMRPARSLNPVSNEQLHPVRIYIESSDHPWVYQSGIPPGRVAVNHQPNLAYDKYPQATRSAYSGSNPARDSGYGSQTTVSQTDAVPFPDRADPATGNTEAYLGNVVPVFQAPADSSHPVHTANAPHKPMWGNCRDCGQALRTASEAKKHDNRHNRPFRCDIPNCKLSKGFQNQNDLDRHKKSVHDITPKNGPVDSFICAAAACAGKPHVFKREDNYKQHVQRKHKEDNLEDLVNRSRIARSGLVVPETSEAHTGTAYSDYGSSVNHSHRPSSHHDTGDYPNPMSDDQQDVASWADRSTPWNHESYAGPSSSSPVGHFNGSQLSMASEPILTDPALLYTREFADLPAPPRLPELERWPRPTSNPSIVVRQVPQKRKASEVEEEDKDHEERPSKLPRLRQELTEQLRDKFSEEQLFEVLKAVEQSALRTSEADETARLRISPTPNSQTGEERPTGTLNPTTSKRTPQALIKCDHPDCKGTRTTTSRSELRKHERRHKWLYGCTYPKCYKQSGTINDWKRHESRVHIQDRLWKCNVMEGVGNDRRKCTRLFYYAEPFKDHLVNHHRVNVGHDKNRADRLLEERRIGMNGQTRFWCGFCNEIQKLNTHGGDALKERIEHITLHYKQGKTIDDWVCVELDRKKGELRKELNDNKKDNLDNAVVPPAPAAAYRASAQGAPSRTSVGYLCCKCGSGPFAYKNHNACPEGDHSRHEFCKDCIRVNIVGAE